MTKPRGEKRCQKLPAREPRLAGAREGQGSWLFIESGPFSKAAKTLNLTVRHLEDIRTWIARDPQRSGALIPGTGCLRKARFGDPVRNRGKRGGLRVIYAVFHDIRTIVLLVMYGKNEKEDLTNRERVLLRETAGLMHDELKRGKTTEI